MINTYLPAPGLRIEPAALQIPKAKELAQTICLGRLAFVTLVECRREEAPDTTETIVIDIEVERGQHVIHDIHYIERVAVRFIAHDHSVPEVLSLRPDFPVVPHLNLRPQELPRSLCLFDEPYDEIKLRWTAAWFIERIRTWLAETARGELHAPDQPLEPLLPWTSAHLVLPLELFGVQHEVKPTKLLVHVQIDSGGNTTYIAALRQSQDLDRRPLCVATVVQGSPQPHGIIGLLPRTLKDLHDFLIAAGIDLLDMLRQRFKQWLVENSLAHICDLPLIVIILLPKTRMDGGDVEANDYYAFMSENSLGMVGEQIDVWQVQGGNIVPVLIPESTRRGEETLLQPLNPLVAFSQVWASALSGLPVTAQQAIAAVGIGALGSQIIMNLLRMGFAPWAVIDKDTLLPHNLARHALEAWAVGSAKADALAAVGAAMLNDPHAVAPLVVDVLHPCEREDDLKQVFGSVPTILEMSASIPVARALACDYTSSARRISLFLNPSGTDLVLLAEDTDRIIPLDMLEMQYYRLLVQEESLHGHLQVGGQRQRYARSCRDLSVTIPQDLVGLHAGIGSRAFRAALAQPAAQISVWQAHPEELTVTRIQESPSPMVVQHEGDWTILTDAWLTDRLSHQRQERLPNETGGVLIGAIDQERRRIYVVLSLPSPPDSVEWPTLYIRGYHGLRQHVTEVGAITAGQIGYIGEWHSHPQGHGCAPSNDDRQVLRWLKDERAVDGLPGLMAIVGDNGVCWYLEILKFE